MAFILWYFELYEEYNNEMLYVQELIDDYKSTKI